jgi:succinoglycan biosynthesis protein ExoM
MMNNSFKSTISISHCPKDIAICVTTCFRPEGLRRLLESLAAQQFIKNIRPNIRIAIVDNDANGSARDVCDYFMARHDVKLEYDIEEQRGIPFARNHAINMIKNDVDFIAILDDDEVADVNWLDELMTTQQEFEADIVTGPVLSHFMGPTDKWLQAFFHRSNLQNGQNLLHNYNYVYTSNLLAKAELFQHVHFDERFALNGADDTHLFMQIFKIGYKAIWAENAMVTEWLPESRTNPQWLWKRAYRRGNGFAFCELVQNRTLKTKIQRIAKGLFRLFEGFFITIISLGRKSVLVRGIQTICLGVGMISGSFGVEYQEYKKVHVV